MFYVSLTGKESSAGGGDNKTEERAEGQSDVKTAPNGNGVARQSPDIEIADEAAEKLQDLAV